MKKIRMDRDKEIPVVDDNVNIAAVNVNPSAQILTNPVIMDKIFGYLTVDEVKDARRVCKVWESVGTTCLGRRCSLSINKFIQSCKDDKIGTCLSPPIKNQLVRRVYIADMGMRYVKHIDYDFLAFVMKYQEQIEEIRLGVDRLFARTVELMLQIVNFSKLKMVHLDLNQNHKQSDHVWKDSCHNFLPMPRMTTLKIRRDGSRGEGYRVNEENGFPYYQIVQEIINKSPNLEKLIIENNYYPDLSSCTKLKVLEWKGYPFKPDDDTWYLNEDEEEQEIRIREDFSFSKLFKMLDDVKDTLQELVIGSANLYNWTANREIPVLPDRTNVTFPCFPCLKSLSIYPIDMYILGFEMVTQNELPGLKKLTLKEFDKKSVYLNQLLLKMKTVWTNVEYLSLTGLQYERDDDRVQINKIVKTFPCTTEFHLWIKGDVDNWILKNLQDFKDDLMEIATANWNIQHFEIGIGVRITLSELMEALGQVVSVGCFKELKTLKLISSYVNCNSTYVLDCDMGRKKFEKPFLALRNITFDGIKIKGSTLIEMVKFIRLHDLNIRFLNVD